MNWGDIETWLIPWITRAGVLIAVVGLGYLLSIGFRRLDALGKFVVVYTACGGMMAAGLFAERKDRYSTWGKIMIAGAWAGLYITTFLAHYLPEQFRIIHDPSLAAYLLMAVAAGMIAHSLRYRTQSLTTLTYFIAFLTIALSMRLADQTSFALAATAILAVSMLFILHYLQWRWLALFSLFACYGIHAVWLTPLATFFHGAQGHNFEFWSGLFILILYWITFTVAVFLDRPQTGREQSPGLALTALNFALFTAIFRWHVGDQHPELRWIFTGVMAAAYIILSYLAHNLRRMELYTLQLVIAALGTTMTLYFRLPGSWVAVAWLLQAEALYMAGRLTPETRFRWLGLANFAAVILWMIGHDLFPVSVTREIHYEPIFIFGYSFFPRTLIFALAAIVFYLNAASKYLLAGRAKNGEPFAPIFSYAASVLWLLLMARNWFPNKFLTAAVVAAVLALALMETGLRFRDAHFRGQGLFYAFLAVFTAIVPLVGAEDFYYAKNIYYRIGCEAAVIVFAYVVFYRFRRLVADSGSPGKIEAAAAAFTAMAAVISSLLLYREFEPRLPFMLSLAWIILGVALLEIGAALKNPWFRAQGYLLAILTIVWTIHALTQRHGWHDNPVQNLAAMALVTAAFFYLFLRALAASRGGDTYLSAAERAEPWPSAGPFVSVFFSAAGTILLALLARKTLTDHNGYFIAVAWLVSAVAILEAGVLAKSATLRRQAFILASAAFAYAIYHNVLEPGPMIGPLASRILTLALAAGLFYYLHARIQLAREAGKDWVDAPGLAPFFSWLAAIILVVLIQREFWDRWPAFTALAWSALLLIYLALGIARKDRAFLLQSAVIAALVFAWAIAATIPANGPPGMKALMLAHRLPAAAPVIALFYGLFALFTARGKKLLPESAQTAGTIARDLVSWAAIIMLTALATVLVNEHSRALATVIWILIAIITFEISRPLSNQSLLVQALILAAAVFVRSLLVNLQEPGGNVWLFSGRAASAALAAAGIYYLYFRLVNSHRPLPANLTASLSANLTERRAGQALSGLATILAAVLLLREISPHTWVPLAWTILLLVLISLWVIVRDHNLLLQALLFIIPIVAATLALDFPAAGQFDARAAVAAAVAGLFIARFTLHFAANPANPSPYLSLPPALSQIARHSLALTPALLLTLYVPFEFHGPRAQYLTIALASDGFLILIIGFILKDRPLRFTGLAVLGCSILKVFYDLWVSDVERIYKVIALIGLGIILILSGLIYSRFSAQIKKILSE